MTLLVWVKPNGCIVVHLAHKQQAPAAWLGPVKYLIVFDQCPCYLWGLFVLLVLDSHGIINWTWQMIIILNQSSAPKPSHMNCIYIQMLFCAAHLYGLDNGNTGQFNSSFTNRLRLRLRLRMIVLHSVHHDTSCLFVHSYLHIHLKSESEQCTPYCMRFRKPLCSERAINTYSLTSECTHSMHSSAGGIPIKYQIWDTNQGLYHHRRCFLGHQHLAHTVLENSSTLSDNPPVSKNQTTSDEFLYQKKSSGCIHRCMCTKTLLWNNMKTTEHPQACLIGSRI